MNRLEVHLDAWGKAWHMAIYAERKRVVALLDLWQKNTDIEFADVYHKIKEGNDARKPNTTEA